ncbi:hypothetical protein T4A_8900 [Trichinella pseudospiralis]|uniref:Uncharacterized protein n=1 Tax=Trichinella pseudospiralis TaxID=6337 RepID=A0A0V1DQ83_TRIPS|nr:hypothetical protein T4A_8900 [Trichinella pseudospiralis]
MNCLIHVFGQWFHMAYHETKYVSGWLILVLRDEKEKLFLTGFLFLELEVGLMVNDYLHLLQKPDVIHCRVK